MSETKTKTTKECLEEAVRTTPAHDRSGAKRWYENTNGLVRGIRDIPCIAVEDAMGYIHLHHKMADEDKRRVYGTLLFEHCLRENEALRKENEALRRKLDIWNQNRMESEKRDMELAGKRDPVLVALYESKKVPKKLKELMLKGWHWLQYEEDREAAGDPDN